MKTTNSYIAITDDLNYLAHYGTRGMKRGVWGGNGKKYQNHAVYARFDKRYKRKPSNNSSDEQLLERAINDLGDDITLSYRTYATNPTVKQNWNKAADVGLKALHLNDNFDKQAFDGASKQENREWFLFEDQTIGLPQIAYLMANKGYTADQCNRLMKYASNLLSNKSATYSPEKQEILFYLSEANLGNSFFDFANGCDSVLNGASKRR